jgi:hypothetical protein
MAIFIHFIDLGFWVERMRYKLTNNLLNKNNNMRTLSYALVFGLFFLLFSMPVKAYLFNFTGSTPISIPLGTLGSYIIDNVNAKYDPVNESWYIESEFSKDFITDFNGCYMSVWREDFTVKYTDWKTTFQDISGGNVCRQASWLFNTNKSFDYLVYNNDTTLLWVGSSQNGANSVSGSGITLVDKALTLVFPFIPLSVTGSIYYYSMTQNGMVAFYKDNARDTVKYGDIHSIFRNNALLGTGNGTLTLPASLTRINGNNTIKYVYIPSIDEYWLFLPNQNNELMLIRYDSTFNYVSGQSGQTLTGSITNAISFNNTLYPDYDVLYSERVNPIVYLAIHEYYNNTIEIIGLDPKGTKQANLPISIGIQFMNLTQNDPLLTGGNKTAAISLTTDGDFFYLFYAYNYSIGSSMLNVLQENFTCACSTWSNQTCIDNTHRKQIRQCVPSGCDLEIQYINDPSCQFIPPTENATKQFSNSSLCVNFGNKLGETSKCEFSIKIPDQCQSNSVTVTLESHLESQDNKQCNKGNYNLTLCNPSFSCLNYYHPCDEFNWTHSYPRYTYQPSNTGFLQAIGYIPTSCGQLSCLWNALDRWDFFASVKIECTLGCYQHKVCGSGELLGYSCVERSDCVQENCTFCNNGCKLNSGECLGAGGEGLPTPEINQDIFSYSLGLSKNLFSSVTLTLMSVCIIGGTMFTVAYEGKDRIPMEIVLAIGILMSFVFWKIQWLDSIYMILFILVLALFFGNKIASNIKGKGE